MPVDEKTRDALRLDHLDLPTEIPISRIEVEEYTDATGDQALRVREILDETAEVEKLSGDSVGELKARIHESLRDHGVALYSYIFFGETERPRRL